MVAAELANVAEIPAVKTTRSSRVTIERRRVTGKQLRFDWDEKESAPAETKTKPTQAKTALAEKGPAAAGAVKSRVGEATKLGVVMLRLLKSYGITDEEIIEGLSMPTVG